MALHLSITFSTPWLQAYTKASEMTKKKKRKKKKPQFVDIDVEPQQFNH